jgi:hypothetical protein
MSVKTITVTPISGILTPINVEAIKAVKQYKEVYHHDVHPDDISLGAVIILDADITGKLTDERIKVDETVEEVKAMLANIEKTELE